MSTRPLAYRWLISASILFPIALYARAWGLAAASLATIVYWGRILTQKDRT